MQHLSSALTALLALFCVSTCSAQQPHRHGGCNIPTSNNYFKAFAAQCSFLPEYNFNYSIVAATDADSVQSTTFTYVGSDRLAGSFELDLSLASPDSLLVVLGGKNEAWDNADPFCDMLVICNATVHGPRQRLRLNTILGADRSYTMQVFKFTNLTALCDAPQVRFFYTWRWGNARDSPMVQLRPRMGHDRRVDCKLVVMDVYLRADSGDLLPLSVNTPWRGWSTISFSAIPARNWGHNWTEVDVTYSEFEITHQRGFWKRSFSLETPRGNSIRDLLCRPMLDGCWADVSVATPCAQFGDSRQSNQDLLSKERLIANVMMPFALTATPILAVLVFALLIWCRTPANPRILLVFPDDAAAADSLRRSEAVGRFRRKLRASGILHVRELVGLRSLTPDLVRRARLVVFLSDDPAFCGFGLDGLPADVGLAIRTVLTERHRTRGLYAKPGPPPPSTSDWAGLSANLLGDTVWDVRHAVHSLTDPAFPAVC